jgi:tetratricopeptide (TPR) repeat protein
MPKWPMLIILLVAGTVSLPAWAFDWDTCKTIKGEAALRACTEIIESSSASPADKSAALRNRGLTYDSLGDHDRAIAEYDKSLLLWPDYAEVLNSRGFAYYEKGDDDRAVADYDKAIRLKPDFDLALTNRGLIYVNKGDYDLAIADFDKLLLLEPDNATGLNNRGFSYYAKGDYERAVADYDKAIELRPDYGLALNNRGLLYEKKGDHDRAIADLDRAIASEPTLAWAFDNRGNAYNNKGQYDRAIVDYDRAIQLSPGFVNTYLDRSLAYESKGDHDRALADLNKALELKPTYFAALRQRGWIRWKKGSFDLSAIDYGNAIAVNPADSETYRGRGEAYYSLKRYNDALADFSKALELKPDNGYSLYDRGITYTALGLKDKAVVDLQAALRLLPQGDTINGYAATTLARLQVNPVGTIRRVALVIGNSSYRSVALLPNPARDAELVGAALRNAGVDDVTVTHDLDRDGMIAALRAFAKKADEADWAVIYYAGHGMEMDGKNYLIPVDAKLDSDRDVPDETVSLDRMMTAIEGAHKLKLVVLDACRNNPFASQMKMSSANRAIERGLSRVEPATATLVVYAAKEGTTAQDGDSTDSPFALAFARRIVEPGVEINKVFRFVTRDVLTQTANQQEPFVYGSLPPDDFIFVPVN